VQQAGRVWNFLPGASFLQAQEIVMSRFFFVAALLASAAFVGAGTVSANRHLVYAEPVAPIAAPTYFKDTRPFGNRDPLMIEEAIGAYDMATPTSVMMF
jgi:hypothetical protein